MLLEHANKEFKDEITVFHFLLAEFSNDPELKFNNSAVGIVFSELYEMDIPSWPGQQYYINHPNMDISTLAIQLLNRDYTLSEGFANNGIYILTEEKNHKQELLSVVLHLRRKKLDNIIKSRINELENEGADTETILEHLNYLNDTKLRIANELGGTVY